MALSPDGRLLATPSEDGTIRLWDCTSGAVIRCMDGKAGGVLCAAWSPDGNILATGGANHTVLLWNPGTGGTHLQLLGHRGLIKTVAWSPVRNVLASGSADMTTRLWDAATGRALQRELMSSGSAIESVAWSPDGRWLCAGSWGNTVRLWDAETGAINRVLLGNKGRFTCVAWSVTGQIASGSLEATISLWDPKTGKQTFVLEAHTSEVVSVAFLDSGRLLASLGRNGAMIVWRTDTLAEVLRVNHIGSVGGLASLAAHQTLPILAAPGLANGAIDIWDLDFALLRGTIPTTTTSHYVNAKVVLVGDTGVGKSGLRVVLNGKPFEATDSTPGRHVGTFASCEVESPGKPKQTRETLLWDLAGQPGYRVIHQLHLNEIAVALVIFDARSETDPLAGVRHWERALRVAHQRQGGQAVPLKP
jgi:WD40 repeat protein